MKALKIFLLFITLTSIALSGQKKDSLKTYTLKPNITTGTRTEVSQANLPASVSVISSVEIEQSGENSIIKLVGDKIPGMFLTEKGILGYGAAQGAAGGITIRGMGGSPTNGVLVLIDGRPQFMGIFGHPFPDNYLSMNTERVEVIRGPASVLYGTNAMGGVINIITKKNNTPGIKATLNNSLGTYNTIINDIGLGYSNGSLELYGSYNHSQTDGHRDYTKFNMNSGYSKILYTISEEYSLNADFNISKFRTFDPGTIYSPLINNWMEISRGSIGFSLNNQYSNFDGGLKFYYNWGENNVYDGWHSKDKNINLLVYQNLKLINNNVTTVGIDYKHYGGEGENIKSGMFSKLYIEGKNYVDETGLYFLSQQYFSNKFVLNGGLRYENNSKFGAVVIPQIGLAYHFDENNTIKAIVSKGFRSPSVKDMFLFPVRNPDLKPEVLWNYEIGFINNVSEKISLETAFFIAKGDNIIIQEGVAPNARLRNSGSFEHKGIELLAKIIGSKNLNFAVSYTYLDPDKQTMSNPRHKFFAEANYNVNNFVVNLNLKQISKLYGSDYSRLCLPDYTLLNSSISYNLLKSIKLFIAGDNLFNQSYQTMYGYSMPGRTFRTGINLSY
jgi:outer membrane cobalamin receptor